MAASKPLTEGERLRLAGQQIVALGEHWDQPSDSLVTRQRMHDAVELAAGNARAVVRGRP